MQVRLEDVVHRTVTQSYDELYEMRLDAVRMPKQERRKALSQFFKRQRHRLMQLYALLRWADGADGGEARLSALRRVVAASAHGTGQAAALAAAVDGVWKPPAAPGQPPQFELGLREVQFKQQSYRAPLPATRTALHVLVGGTYAALPRSVCRVGVPSSTPLAVFDDAFRAAVVPAAGSDALLQRMTTALQLRVAAHGVPGEFSVCTVRHGRVVLEVAGEFTVALSATGTGLSAPWTVVNVDVHLGARGQAGSHVSVPDANQVQYLGGFLQHQLRQLPPVPAPAEAAQLQPGAGDTPRSSGDDGDAAADTAAVPNPFRLLYNVLHELSCDLALDALALHASRMALRAAAPPSAGPTGAGAVGGAGAGGAGGPAAGAGGAGGPAAGAGGAGGPAAGAAGSPPSSWSGVGLRVQLDRDRHQLLLAYWPPAAIADATGAMLAADTPLAAQLAGCMAVEVCVDDVAHATARSLVWRPLPAPDGGAAPKARPVKQRPRGWVDAVAVLRQATDVHASMVLTAMQRRLQQGAQGGATPWTRVDVGPHGGEVRAVVEVGVGLAIHVTLRRYTGRPHVAVARVPSSHVAVGVTASLRRFIDRQVSALHRDIDAAVSDTTAATVAAAQAPGAQEDGDVTGQPAVAAAGRQVVAATGRALAACVVAVCRAIHRHALTDVVTRTLLRFGAPVPFTPALFVDAVAREGRSGAGAPPSRRDSKFPGSWGPAGLSVPPAWLVFPPARLRAVFAPTAMFVPLATSHRMDAYFVADTLPPGAEADPDHVELALDDVRLSFKLLLTAAADTATLQLLPAPAAAVVSHRVRPVAWPAGQAHTSDVGVGTPAATSLGGGAAATTTAPTSVASKARRLDTDGLGLGPRGRARTASKLESGAVAIARATIRQAAAPPAPAPPTAAKRAATGSQAAAAPRASQPTTPDGDVLSSTAWSRLTWPASLQAVSTAAAGSLRGCVAVVDAAEFTFPTRPEPTSAVDDVVKRAAAGAAFGGATGVVLLPPPTPPAASGKAASPPDAYRYLPVLDSAPVVVVWAAPAVATWLRGMRRTPDALVRLRVESGVPRRRVVYAAAIPAGGSRGASGSASVTSNGTTATAAKSRAMTMKKRSRRGGPSAGVAAAPGDTPSVASTVVLGRSGVESALAAASDTLALAIGRAHTEAHLLLARTHFHRRGVIATRVTDATSGRAALQLAKGGVTVVPPTAADRTAAWTTSGDGRSVAGRGPAAASLCRVAEDCEGVGAPVSAVLSQLMGWRVAGM